MPCFHPNDAWSSRKKNPETGKSYITFDYGFQLKNHSYEWSLIKLPCGQCVGCRLERSRQWAIRCVHEAQLYENNCFITLTYNDQSLPEDGGLHVDHFQKFMKRLRKRFTGLSKVYGHDADFNPTATYPIRFFHCGEYGEKYGRPHYHACLFNFDFQDKKLWKQINGQNLYISESLSELWPHGFSTVGTVTFESAAYVARYIMKKVNGDAADDHYYRYDHNGLVYSIKPEYTTMSRRPGIAHGWYERYKSDVYPDDFVVLNNKKMRPPKYYDGLYEISRPELYEDIKHDRYLNGLKHLDNNSPERLNIREQVLLAKLKQLPRTLD